MTTRHRRNSRDQAGDALRKLLKSQQAETTRRKVAYEEALAAEQPTRRALESLGMEPLPGMDAFVLVESFTPPPELAKGAGDDLSHPATMDTPVGVGNPGVDAGDMPPLGATTPFKPPPASVAACPHAKTETRKDGYHYCLECGQRVIRTGE